MIDLQVVLMWSPISLLNILETIWVAMASKTNLSLKPIVPDNMTLMKKVLYVLYHNVHQEQIFWLI